MYPAQERYKPLRGDVGVYDRIQRSRSSRISAVPLPVQCPSGDCVGTSALVVGSGYDGRATRVGIRRNSPSRDRWFLLARCLWRCNSIAASTRLKDPSARWVLSPPRPRHGAGICGGGRYLSDDVLWTGRSLGAAFGSFAVDRLSCVLEQGNIVAIALLLQVRNGDKAQGGRIDAIT